MEVVPASFLPGGGEVTCFITAEKGRSSEGQVKERKKRSVLQSARAHGDFGDFGVSFAATVAGRRGDFFFLVTWSHWDLFKLLY